MNDLKYRLISRKFREGLLLALFMILANNMTLFVDSILVSNLLGASGLPAIQLCFPVITLACMVCGMLGIGGSRIAFDAIADYNSSEADSFFSVSLFAMLAFGLLTSALGILFPDSLTGFLCQSPDLYQAVDDYCSALLPGIPFLCFLMGICCFARLDGSPHLPFHILLIVNAFNLFMDIIFMQHYGLGLKGAALATLLGYLGGTLYSLRYLLSGNRRMRFTSPFKSGPADFRQKLHSICISGFPAAAPHLYVAVVILALNTLITWYGGVPGLQAYAVCQNNLFLVSIIFIATVQVVSPLLAVYFHDGDYDQVRILLKKTLGAVSCATAVPLLLFTVFPGLLLRLYNITAPEAAVVISQSMGILIVCYLGTAVNSVIAFYLQIIRRPELSWLITAFRCFVLPLSLVYILTGLLGLTGVWIGLSSAEFLTIVLTVIAMNMLQRRHPPEIGSFLLPASGRSGRYAFSLKMDMLDAVKLSQLACEWIELRVNHRMGKRASLALEEILTGIISKNQGSGGLIDVVILDEKDSVVISVKDIGEGWDPVAADSADEFPLDRISTLSRQESNIHYHRSLGINTTQIYLSKQES